MPADPERRRHRRLAIRLLMDCRLVDDIQLPVLRAVTRNVSSGGVYFEMESDPFRVGANLVFELVVPPGDGYFPTSGRVRGAGEVIRVEELPVKGNESAAPSPRFGVAARFSETLQLHF